MKKILSLSLIIPTLFTLQSCKTQEQIIREQQIDTMSVQMVQNQQLTADSTVKLQTMDERINKFQGILEEAAHKKDQKNIELENRIKLLEDLNTALTQENKEVSKKINFVEKRLAEQDKFIKEILSTLKSKKTARKKKVKKRSQFQEAMYQYGKGRYKTARPLLEALEGSKKLSSKNKARVLHNLGMVSFIQKRNDDALTYFSKLYTQFPRSTYNANGLIHLAKTFSRMGQKDQAKETLNEMIAKFPKHKRVKIAKNLLKKL